MLGRQVRSVGIAVTVTAVAVQTLAYIANEVMFGGRFEQLQLGTLSDGLMARVVASRGDAFNERGSWHR
jgi:hypothetical protein